MPPSGGFGFRVLDFGFRNSGFGFQVSVLIFRCRVSGFGFLVSGVGFRVSGFWCRVSGFGFRVSGFRVLVFGFRVSGFGFRVSGIPGFEFWVSGIGSQGFAPSFAVCAAEGVATGFDQRGSWAVVWMWGLFIRVSNPGCGIWDFMKSFSSLPVRYAPSSAVCVFI